HAPVSELERFYIEGLYHLVTGDLEKARQVYEISAQTYPRDAASPAALSGLYFLLGQHDKALAARREAIGLDPSTDWNTTFIDMNYIDLNRLDDARAAAQEAQAKQLDSPWLCWVLYRLQFAPIEALAHLQLGRAYAMSADKDKAKSAYQ